MSGTGVAVGVACPLALDGASLDLAAFLAVVRRGRPVELAPEARVRVVAARDAVDRAVAEGRALYGVTTGFGSLSDRVSPAAQARELQISLVRSHASGTG